MKKPVAVFALFAVLILTGLQAEETVPKDETYVGFGGIVSFLGGDFDGKMFFYDYTEAIAVPKVDPGFGFEVTLGIRSGHFGLEIFLNYAGSDGTFGNASYDVQRIQLGVGGKFFPLPEQILQPFFSAGIGAEFLVVKDGSVNSLSERGDATFSGIDFRIGGGLAYYITSRFAVNLKAEFVHATFNEAEGVEGVKKTISPSLKAPGLACGVIFTYSF